MNNNNHFFKNEENDITIKILALIQIQKGHSECEFKNSPHTKLLYKLNEDFYIKEKIKI